MKSTEKQHMECTKGTEKDSRANKQRAAQREPNLKKMARRSRRSCDKPSRNAADVGDLESLLGTSKFCISFFRLLFFFNGI